MRIEVVTPKGAALETDADELIAPGVRGEFGVLPGHTPFISALKPGVLSWKEKGKRSLMAVGSGYAEVNGQDKVVVLTEQFGLNGLTEQRQGRVGLKGRQFGKAAA